MLVKCQWCLLVRNYAAFYFFLSIKFYTKLDHKEEEHVKIVIAQNRMWPYRLEYMREINSFV